MNDDMEPVYLRAVQAAESFGYESGLAAVRHMEDARKWAAQLISKRYGVQDVGRLMREAERLAQWRVNGPQPSEIEDDA